MSSEAWRDEDMTSGPSTRSETAGKLEAVSLGMAYEKFIP